MSVVVLVVNELVVNESWIAEELTGIGDGIRYCKRFAGSAALRARWRAAC
jgi:hypothetical protein